MIYFLSNLYIYICIYSDASIYRIYFPNCQKSYIEETSGNLPRRIKEHKRDFNSGNFSNALIIHNISKNHKFDFQRSNIITFIPNKDKRKIIESSAISRYNTTEQRPGFYKISPYLAKIILKDLK